MWSQLLTDQEIWRLRNVVLLTNDEYRDSQKCELRRSCVVELYTHNKKKLEISGLQNDEWRQNEYRWDDNQGLSSINPIDALVRWRTEQVKNRYQSMEIYLYSVIRGTNLLIVIFIYVLFWCQYKSMKTKKKVLDRTGRCIFT